MKPVALVARAIQASSGRGALVYEPFSGSGTTIVACEQLGRRCRAVELDPRYVDVGVRRWQTLTGHEAVLKGDGRSFAVMEAERRPAREKAPAGSGAKGDRG
jgi:DNA modification methylase